MACPKLVCLGARASFDPLKPGQRTLIDYLLPWIEECVSLLLKCVFCLISPTYKYVPTLVEMVGIKPLPLG